jgi:tyrosyl-DNA phosphodiesterase 2
MLARASCQQLLSRFIYKTANSFARKIMSRIQHPTLPRAPAQWTPDTPCEQPYFTYSSKGNMWVSSEDNNTPQSSLHSKDEPLSSSQPILTVLTWNIDFMRPLANERMTAALSYLETYLSSSVPSSNAVLILLQEMVQSGLHLIQSAPWIRSRFHLTDTSTQNWESGHYGTCTLIDKRLHVKDVFRIHYSATRMARDALFVDIAFPSSPTEQPALTSTTMPDPKTLAQQHRPSERKLIRIVNTHLESLRAIPPLRPFQLSTAARFMRPDTKPGVHASVLAGDLNAIEPFDRTLHSDNGLRDAYLELGGEEDSEDGYTWGQMAGKAERERHGCCRMDKVYFTGRGLELRKVERAGSGVEVEKKDDREMLKTVAGLEGGWVTDHLGVRVDFEVTDEVRSQT